MSGRKQKILWIIDLLCLLGFLVALTPSITGLQIHEWLGLAAGSALLVHVLLHRGWIVSVTRRLNAIRSRKIIWRYNLNVGLFVSFTTILVTGVLISSTFNLGVEHYALWRFLHVLASYMTLGLLVVKVALHWQWIVRTTRHHIWQLPVVTAQPITASSLAGERSASEHAASRREFLTTAGWATVGLTLAGVETAIWIRGELESDATSATTVESTASTYSTASYSRTSQSSSIRCNKGCTSPHCPRYTDANGNSLCDLSEA